MTTEGRKLAAIMFTDIVGYSALSQRNEALALELLGEHQRLLRSIFASHDGHEVKSTGDGFFVEFPSALEATLCAIAIQKALVERNASAPLERHIRVRIGLHLGDVTTRDGDVFGDGVNIAARVEPFAEPGGICVTHAVHDQVQNKIDMPLRPIGHPDLKNISTPIALYSVVLPWLPPPRPRHRTPTLKSARSLQWIAWLVVAVLAGGVSWWLWTRPPAPVQPATENQSIAVLPFLNMSADRDDEYLADGMTEEVITALSKITGLHVAARTSSFAFKGKDQQIEKIGEQLHVANVLEGSVRKVGEKVRITVQLINIADGYHLWSETYDRDLADIFAIESDVANQVATALRLQLLASDRKKLDTKATENVEAHELYMKGRFYAARFTRKGLGKGLYYFQQAIALDPKYAPAYIGMAYYWVTTGDWQQAPIDTMPKARDAAMKALSLDDSLGEAHAFLAIVSFWYDWNTPAAEKEFKQALELAPRSSFIRSWYSQYLLLLKEDDAGIAEGQQAVQLDPLSPESNMYLGDDFYIARRYDEAIRQLRQTIELEPKYWYSYLVIGRAYAHDGQLTDAIQSISTAKDLESEQSELLGALGWTYAVDGQTEKAQQILKELEERSQHEYVAAYQMADVAVGLGQTDEAFRFLEKAISDRSFYVQWLRVDPDFDSIRGDPRYAALLKKAGFD